MLSLILLRLADNITKAASAEVKTQEGVDRFNKPAATMTLNEDQKTV